MKILFSVLLILLLSFNSKGQLRPNSLAKFSDIKLVKASLPITPFVKGTPKSTVINAYGNPATITTMPWDDLDVGIDGYQYNNNKIYIDTDNQKLWGFKIVNTDFRVSYNNHTINVGDNISTLSSIFNISYTNRYDDLISIGLTFDNGVPYDYVLRILFNPSTNIITEISIGYY